MKPPRAGFAWGFTFLVGCCSCFAISWVEPAEKKPTHDLSEGGSEYRKGVPRIGPGKTTSTNSWSDTLKSLVRSSTSAMDALPPVGDWAVYEDALIRFKRPRGWETKFSQDEEDKKRTWWVEVPDLVINKKMRIAEQLSGEEKRSLERILSDSKKNDHRSTVVEGPKRLKLNGAGCLTYKWSHPSGGQHPPKEGEPDYMNANASADCYTERGTYVDISLRISSRYLPGKPDETYKKNSAFFDALLQSLEFKPIADRSAPKGN